MQFKIIAAQDLDRNQRHQIAELCFSAFDEDPWTQYAFMQKAIHVAGILNNQDVKTAYVEYVTTDYTMRGKGLASQLLKYLVDTLTHLEYGLAALQPEDEAFYEKLGWTVWKGNLSIKQNTCSYLTDEYEIMLYPLNIQMKDQLSNSSEEDTICADWREGELW